MGGLQAATPPTGTNPELTPEELHKRWLALQADNERKRQMAMNEVPGWTSQLQDHPSQTDPYSVISKILQQTGGF